MGKISIWQQIKTRFLSDKRFLFFAALEFVFWAMIAPAGFNVVFMNDLGFNNVQTGVGLAVNAIANFIFLPIWGMVADRMGSKRKTLIVLYIGTIITSVATSFLTGSVLLTTMLAGSVMAFRGPVPSLTDSWLIEEVSMPDMYGNRLNYGPIRLFGSIGYAIAGFIFYYLFNNLNVNTKYTFLFSAILAVLTMFLVISYGKQEKAEQARISDYHKPKPVRFKMSELKPGRLFKNFYFITFLFVYMLISVPGNFGMGYVSTLLGEVGGAPVFVGVIGSIRALCEVPPLLFSRKIMDKLGYVKTIFIISGLLLIEQSIYIFCNAMWQVVTFQMLHGVINGLLLGAAVNYIFSLVPRELSATAQTLCAAACSIFGILGNFVSGVIIDAFGLRMIYIICTIAIALAIVIFAGSLIIGKRLGLKRYDPETDLISRAILEKKLATEK